MASFYTALQELKSLIEAGLLDFCSSRWGKLPTLTISYKKRTEIALDAFPIGFITRPQVENQDDVTGFNQSGQTVLLYFGILEEDREKAAQAVIELEEEIETIIRANRTLNDKVQSIEINNSANDEGNFHPVYFISVEMNATHRTL